MIVGLMISARSKLPKLERVHVKQPGLGLERFETTAPSANRVCSASDLIPCAIEYLLDWA